MIHDYVPFALVEIIADYLRSQCTSARSSAWRRNRHDEDSITAAFFQTIVTPEPILFRHGDVPWLWSIDYSTTSSRGKGSLEAVLGADVIIFIEVILKDGTTFRKGILVQGKVAGKIGRGKLVQQLDDIEAFAPNSGVVLVYDRSGYSCVTGPEYMSRRGERFESYSQSFCEFLANEFVKCHYGVENLYYDFEREEVTFQTSRGIKFLPQKGVSRIKIRRADMDSNIRSSFEI
jgi:hypothetical protein